MKYMFDDCTIVVMYVKLDTFDKKNIRSENPHNCLRSIWMS